MNFLENPVIAAVRHEEGLQRALKGAPAYIFLLNSDILTLKDTVKKAHEAGKKIFVHVDFVEGLGKDKVGMMLLAHLKVDGVITTRANIVKMAKEVNLLTVQRFFIVDSHSFDTAIESVRASHPDMIEVMPALVTREIQRLKDEIRIPVIAGGLLESRSEIYAALSAGASAVSTGKYELWE